MKGRLNAKPAVILALALSAALAACDSGDSSLARISGHYEGTLTNHLDGKSYAQTPVSADIAAANTSNGGSAALAPITIQDESGATLLVLQITLADDGSISVQAEPGAAVDILRAPVNLALNSDSSCYVGTAGYKTSLCASSSAVKLELDDAKDGTAMLSLELYPFKAGDAVPVNETPQAFTLSQAIERARKMSFNSRIEFEHVIQAKAHAKAAYLALLPQITLGTIANNITVKPFSFVGTFTTLLQGIGDLLPFLLPDRWFQADAAANQSWAEQDTKKLMSLDTGVQVEGLFYAYARDVKTRALTAEMLKQTTAIRDEVQNREDSGQLPAGSANNVNSVLNQLQQSLSTLDEVTAEDLAAISQSLGFYSPTTVTGAMLDSEQNPVETAKAVDYKTINDIALKRSVELDQFDALIAASKDTKKASYFSWLDPYGDPSLGLGFALPSQIEVLDSQVNELVIDKEQVQANLSQQRAFDAVTDYNQALQAFQIAQDGMKIQKARLDDALVGLNDGAEIDFFGLIGILQDNLTTEITVENARANFRVARSTIDRLLLQGYYANF